jgi:glycosyltransferase involved in cell wall biosynthesis
MTVFIGIPTFNRPELVVATVQSVRRQSLTDYQVVVSDNCSRSDAAERVRRYVESIGDPRFRFHQQPSNGGEYAQGRYFMKASEGADYLMILHDDDVIDPELLARAVAVLDERPEIDLFVANCWVTDHDGQMSPDATRQYLAEHGRCSRPAGEFDILDHHLATGFTPISGTVFRRDALVRSGFVDPAGEGNFPFECDLFLRLGDIRAKGWFMPAQLLSIRFHEGSLRRTLRLMDNPAVVRPMLRLLQQRRYSGWLERRRRVVVSRLQRADALIHLRQGHRKAARKRLAEACRSNPLSPKGWGTRLLAWWSPNSLVERLPPLPPSELLFRLPDTAAASAGPAKGEARGEDVFA